MSRNFSVICNSNKRRRRQTVLVTGASGFIGTNIVKYLLDEGYAVIAVDTEVPRHICESYCYTYTGEGLCTVADIWVVKGDMRDTKLLGKLLERKVSYVIHLAAVSTIQTGAEDSAKTMSINVGGTESLLKAIKKHGGVKGLIYASTDKVYGELHSTAYTENSELVPLDSPYDVSKAKADCMVRKWCADYGIHGIVLRFCNIYGKYDRQATRIIPAAIKALLGGRECVLRMYRDSTGEPRNFVREFLYVDDLCETIGKVMDKMELWNLPDEAQNARWGEAFNLGGNRCYAIQEVIGKIQEIIGGRKDMRVEFARTLAEIPEQKMDYAKAQDCFGFVPKTSLDEGLRETVGWWQRNL